MTADDYKLQPMTEAEIAALEDKVFQRLCGNACTSEVAAWLSIFHSHFLRLNNRVSELEKKTP